MSSKRKQTALGLERRVRARREDSWEPESESDGEASGDEISEGTGEDDDSGSGASEAESGSASESDDSNDGEETAPAVNLSSISFGALARAQASLPPASRRSKKAPADDATATSTPQEASSRSGARKKAEPESKPKRSSKHAPQEQTSKKPVSRRREILADPRRKHRDPRFDPLVGSGRVDESKTSKAYAFLDEYRDSEMADLRAQIKKTKGADAKERLKRQLMSMESRKKAARKKLEQDALLREHRHQEKELVAQGKKPFYLKKSEQKERLLTKRYDGMSKGQVDKAIARKRKKVAGKEKKELDSLQRVRDRR